jgi:hypothetical protein
MNIETTAALKLLCCDCEQEFLFDSGESAYFRERGLQQPRRCRDCRRAAKQHREQLGLTQRYHP